MNHWLTTTLGNISVNRKLSLGFGLVLIMTLLITATGWSGLTSIIDRSKKLSTISDTVALVKDLRIARVSYDRDNGENGPGEVNDLLNDIDNNLTLASKLLGISEDLAMINQELQAVAQYKNIFSQIDKATQARELNRARLGSSAQSAADTIDGIEKDVLKGNDLAMLNRVNELSRQLQHARYQVRGYTHSGDADAAQPALDAILFAQNELTRLSAQLPGEYSPQLQQAAHSLKNYGETFVQFRDSQLLSDQQQNSLQALGDSLVSLSHELATSQTTKRDNDAQQAKTSLTLCAVLALALGTLAAWLITRQIVTPLQHTLRIVEAVAAGDLSQDHPTQRRDELGQVQQAIARMTGELRDLIGGISDGVTQIASAAEQLSAVTEQTSAGVNSQKVETDQVATAMHEMAATVHEVARNAEEASEAAVAADQQAREGDTVVAQAIEQIEHLAAEVLKSTDAMTHLQQESGKIGSVLDVIKSVSQQTNLLALNAAIEAARAGEAGRGFAVVADEVRSLAQRTQASTEEIEELIVGLQSGTQRVSTSMDNSRVLTDSSVELTRRAGASLSTITRTVSTIQGMNQQIAAAAEQQSSVAEEINRSVLNVRDVSEQTAAASEETAASSVELARLGTHLQTLVGRFKV
ncbi:chemotaxis protein [Pseudomonas weihenstephanensis]|nr:methyl-accepting chemotaxis protein [Pseudomonas weihenstephanensis]KMN19080.1 chemotaxis protein [Pseudomonas weihenstephanensis]